MSPTPRDRRPAAAALPRRPRRRHSHHVSRPSTPRAPPARSPAAPARAPGQHPGGRDRQHGPLRAATTLRQRRGGQRRAHPRHQPLAGEEDVAGGADGQHPRAIQRRDVDAERRMRNASTSPSKRAPSGVTSPSAAPAGRRRVQRERDRGERHEQPPAGGANDPRPARRRRRPACARVSVTHDAGPSRSPAPLRPRPRASAAAMAARRPGPRASRPRRARPSPPERRAAATWATSATAGPAGPDRGRARRLMRPRTGTRGRSAAAPRRRSGAPRRASRAARRATGSARRLTNRGAARVADEERRDDELQLVGQVVGEELGVDDAAALDHQPPHAAVGEVVAQPAHPHAPPAVDDRRRRRRAAAARRRPARGGVDELLGLAGGEEARRRRRGRMRPVTVIFFGEAAARGPRARRGGRASARAAAGCPCAR